MPLAALCARRVDAGTETTAQLAAMLGVGEAAVKRAIRRHEEART
jgi:DNA-binding MurR/RpiR family transcriptional regulator